MDDRLTATVDQMLREQLPNLFRLYLNPYVAQTCFCLSRYAQASRLSLAKNAEEYQSFLANSFDEALSGAIKLARYCCSVAGKSTAGLVIDPEDRLGPFASEGNVVFVPGLTVVGKIEAVPTDAKFGFVVLASGDDPTSHASLAKRLASEGALVIVCVDRHRLKMLLPANPPDIVVFDGSFVNDEVPFGAFSATRRLYDHWNKPGKSTFHSTTFQPNTISALHFMRCLEKDDPEFFAIVQEELREIDTNPDLRLKRLRRLYSPSLASAIAATGYDTPRIRAAGHYVIADGRPVLDTVGGVACSVRGHNPPTYAEEIAAFADVDCEAELAARLKELTGHDHVLPSVSGSGAVENALKIALAAQFPIRHVLALKSGFGGKTLFALTGTWNSTYKEHIDPLYGDVIYVDPFADDAIAQIDAAMARHPIAVVQMELVQGVGGVRPVPEPVVRHLDACRARHGCLLLIDEIQTGMFRTGQFSLSRAMGLTPDLMVVGKAVSDMMFPFALTLYSEHVQARLSAAGSTLPAAIRKRFAFPFGCRTAVNVLRFAERVGLSEQVVSSGELFAKLLREELAACSAVREVRVHGLLIGIELDATPWPQRWFKKRLFWFYLSSMLQHPRFPVLVGFCQYEPNVLKITPPLTIQPDEIRQMCATIGEVIRRPFYKLLTSAASGMLKSLGLWRRRHGNTDKSAHAPAAG